MFELVLDQGPEVFLYRLRWLGPQYQDLIHWPLKPWPATDD